MALPLFSTRAIVAWPIGGGTTCYEERITIWRASDLRDALERGAQEAERYAEGLREIGVEATALSLTQSFALSMQDDDQVRIDDGTEVFSLIRDSTLSPAAYLDRFFDTGSERQRDA